MKAIALDTPNKSGYDRVAMVFKKVTKEYDRVATGYDIVTLEI